ncbi:hypothetical protein SBOR_9719 [Sclerotinia borealis F-4128]|uniref:RTA1 domain protein n=1 Tax=Sclerotinia borealis (strain F-4128) TaxID=1432307 RepID=W9C4R8_SCLBF|nr:hypothetical protein SBOR_9719 [Sclerotinia borealis F-4128]
MPELLPYSGDYYLWNYVPSMAAAVIFIILFIATTGLNSWRMFKTKTWFCVPMALGCIFEVVGYIGRAKAVNSTGTLLPYVFQSSFTLLAPALFSASIYMTLGRIMRYVKGEHHSLIRITWVTKIFVIGDIFSFMVQGGSSSLMFNSSTVKMGEKVVLAGLFIQIISFGFFFVTALIFERRMRKAPTAESFIVKANWIHYLYVLYAMSVLIMVRSIFRVIEYAEGQTGYPLKHEWTLYIFDAVPMFIVTLIFFIYHPYHLQVRTGATTSIGSEEEAHSIQLMNNPEQRQGRKGKPFGAGIATTNASSVTTPDSSTTPPNTQSNSQTPHGFSLHPETSSYVNFTHLELFQHFQDNQGFIWGDNLTTQSSRTNVLKYAFVTPFLMYELLAYSALHISIIRPDQFQFYHDESRMLQQQSLKLFNDSVQEVNDENLIPSFLYSGILGHHTFVDTFSVADSDLNQFIDKLVQAIKLMRGVRVCFTGWWEVLEKSEIRGLMQHGDGHVEHTDEYVKHFLELQAKLPGIPGIDHVELEALQEAVRQLKWVHVSSLFNLGNGNLGPTMVTSWPITLSLEYSELLLKRRPGALVVLAYFSVLLNLSRKHWAVGSAGKFLLDVVGTCLGKDWDTWLEWPRSKVLGDV